MEALSLFDFEFGLKEKRPVSSQQIEEWTKQIQDFYLKRGNGLWPEREEILQSGFTSETLDELIKNNILDFFYPSHSKKMRLSLKKEYRRYLAVEEVAANLEQKIEEALLDGHHYYHLATEIRNYHFTDEPFHPSEKKEYEKLSNQIMKRYAIKLGLDHFINVPESRGTKMNRFSDRFVKSETIPMIANHIIPMTDFDEIKSYFDNHAFFCGPSTYGAPYPEVKTIMVNTFIVACLAEATDMKTVRLILSYTGGGWLNKHDPRKRAVLYPEGWSHERYMEELTADEIEAIFKDMERLERMHGKK